MTTLLSNDRARTPSSSTFPKGDDAKLVDAYLTFSEARLSERTRRAYRRHLDALVLLLRGRGKSLVRAMDIDVQAFIDDAAGGADASQRIAAARGFYKWLTANATESVAFTGRIHAPAVTRSATRDVFLEPEAVADLMGGAWARSDRDHALVLALLQTGASVDEVIALEWSAVSEDCHQLTFGVGRRRRAIQSPRTLADALRRLHSVGSEGPVFLNLFGAALTTRSVHAIVAAAGDDLGLDDLTPSAIRLTAVRSLHDADVSIREIARRCGYTDVAARRAIGSIAARTRDCSRCDGRFDPGPVQFRCPVCGGIGAVVVHPAGYAEGLDPHRVVSRLRAWATEARRTAEELWLDRTFREDVRDALGAVADGLDGSATRIARNIPGFSERLAPTERPIERRLVSKRLRACGTEQRKLAACIAELRWGPPAEAAALWAIGVNLIHIAWVIEDGSAMVELRPI